MTIDWATISPFLISSLTTLALDDDANVPDGWAAEWKERKRAFTNPEVGFNLLLKVTTCNAVGEDEIRYELDEETNDYFETLCGTRRFTLQVQVEYTETEDRRWALLVLERIRTRISRRQLYQAMLELDLVVVDYGPTKDISATRNKRVWSMGTFDIIFRTVTNDRNPIPVGWIERIELSTLFAQEGVLLASPPNVSDDSIPP